MPQDAPDFDEILSDRQLAALPYIAESHTKSEAAKRAHIDRKTIWRWMNDEVFKAALKRTREDLAELALSELQGMRYEASLVLQECLHDSNPKIRISAARVALRASNEAQENHELKQKLETMSEALSRWFAQKRTW